MKKIALITGANRGIGFEICRQLAQKNIEVLLTSRDEDKGNEAAQKLVQEGLNVRPYVLDVASAASIELLAKSIERDIGALHILINNAGILIDPKGSTVLNVSQEIFRQTLATNFYGSLQLCQAFVPLMRKQNYGRVVNMSSGLGQLSDMGTGTPAYRVSKVALNALTRMLAAELGNSNILINSVCPGWVKTDMGGPHAQRSAAEGADTAVWLATLPDDGPNGGFFRDRTPIPW